MAEQGLLALFDEPAPVAKSAVAVEPVRRVAMAVSEPVEDPVITLALAYESATGAALDSFDEGDPADQKAACVAFVEAMEPYMALPRLDYQRGQRELRKRGKVSDNDWLIIQAQMRTLKTAN